MPDGRGGCTWFLLASIPEEYDHGTAPWVCMERTPSEVTMPSGRRHDAHNVDIVPMSCKYSFISQDGCPTRNPMTYTCLMRDPPRIIGLSVR